MIIARANDVPGGWKRRRRELARLGLPPIVRRANALNRSEQITVSFLGNLFIWWHGATPGTIMTTWWSGVLVGKDQYGNKYYRSRDGKRRWVVYSGTVEASRVPPDWHGWLHHTFENPPTEEPLRSHPWERGYRPNLTGTADAYRPPGSLWKDGKRPHATGDYEAWRPN